MINKISFLENAIDSDQIENVIKYHEANCLKLHISKTVSQLNWKPILNFEETVSFGCDHKYTYLHIGFNLKVTDIQAALGGVPIGKS